MKKIYLFAVIFALVAGVCTYFFVVNLENQAENSVIGEQTAQVVIAIQDIAKDTAVTADMFKEVTLPTNSITYGTAVNISDLYGYVATDNIYKGEQVLVSKLAIVGENTGAKRLSYNLEDGNYAYTLTVDDENSVAYFIKPGDFVNIYGYGSSAEWTKLLENVEVLKIGTYSDDIQEDSGIEITTYTLLTLSLTEDQIDTIQNGDSETGEIQNYRVVLVPYTEGAEITTVEHSTVIDEDGNSVVVDFELEPATNYGMGEIDTTIPETTEEE